MAMTDADLTNVATELAKRSFVQALATATEDLGSLKLAVGAIDDAMNATGNQIVVQGYGTTALETALLTECQSQAPTLTTQQAGVALALWALKRVGLLA